MAIKINKISNQQELTASKLQGHVFLIDNEAYILSFIKGEYVLVDIGYGSWWDDWSVEECGANTKLSEIIELITKDDDEFDITKVEYLGKCDLEITQLDRL